MLLHWRLLATSVKLNYDFFGMFKLLPSVTLLMDNLMERQLALNQRHEQLLVVSQCLRLRLGVAIS